MAIALPSSQLPHAQSSFNDFICATCHPLEKIAVLCAGGRLNGIYFDDRTRDKQAGSTQILNILEPVCLSMRTRLIDNKSTLIIGGTEREKIIEQIKQSPERQILVTHHADAMQETLRALRNCEGIENKTIVLTDSHLPARIKGSDAPYSTGFATGALAVLPPGLYCVLDGKIHGIEQTLQENDRLEVLAMGGTIDKVYDNGEYKVSETPYMKRLLDSPAFEAIKNNIQCGFQSVCQKDSLHLTEADRAQLAKTVALNKNSKILVTHGTDGLVITAKHLKNYLKAHPELSDKTIVLLGAMNPGSHKSSDGDFNLGFATASALKMPPGVYIAMNANLLDPEHAQKLYSACESEPSRFAHIPTNSGVTKG